jgi:hypothetical protein
MTGMYSSARYRISMSLSNNQAWGFEKHENAYRRSLMVQSAPFLVNKIFPCTCFSALVRKGNIHEVVVRYSLVEVDDRLHLIKY